MPARRFARRVWRRLGAAFNIIHRAIIAAKTRRLARDSSTIVSGLGFCRSRCQLLRQIRELRQESNSDDGSIVDCYAKLSVRSGS
jgi:hypothetical protein